MSLRGLSALADESGASIQRDISFTRAKLNDRVHWLCEVGDFQGARTLIQKAFEEEKIEPELKAYTRVLCGSQLDTLRTLGLISEASRRESSNILKDAILLSSILLGLKRNKFSCDVLSTMLDSKVYPSDKCIELVIDKLLVSEQLDKALAVFKVVSTANRFPQSCYVSLLRYCLDRSMIDPTELILRRCLQNCSEPSDLILSQVIELLLLKKEKKGLLDLLISFGLQTSDQSLVYTLVELDKLAERQACVDIMKMMMDLSPPFNPICWNYLSGASSELAGLKEFWNLVGKMFNSLGNEIYDHRFMLNHICPVLYVLFLSRPDFIIEFSNRLKYPLPPLNRLLHTALKSLASQKRARRTFLKVWDHLTRVHHVAPKMNSLMVIHQKFPDEISFDQVYFNFENELRPGLKQELMSLFEFHSILQNGNPKDTIQFVRNVLSQQSEDSLVSSLMSLLIEAAEKNEALVEAFIDSVLHCVSVTKWRLSKKDILKTFYLPGTNQIDPEKLVEFVKLSGGCCSVPGAHLRLINVLIERKRQSLLLDFMEYGILNKMIDNSVLAECFKGFHDETQVDYAQKLWEMIPDSSRSALVYLEMIKLYMELKRWKQSLELVHECLERYSNVSSCLELGFRICLKLNSLEEGITLQNKTKELGFFLRKHELVEMFYFFVMMNEEPTAFKILNDHSEVQLSSTLCDKYAYMLIHKGKFEAIVEMWKAMDRQGLRPDPRSTSHYARAAERIKDWVTYSKILNGLMAPLDTIALESPRK